jgi:hypothetical protein
VNAIEVSDYDFDDSEMINACNDDIISEPGHQVISPFVEGVMKTETSLRFAVEHLGSGLKHFETQFAEGQLEAIVFEECKLDGNSA